MPIRTISFMLSVAFGVISLFTSCKKLDELNENPEIEPLKQGFQTSAAIGYCASLASSAFRGEALPANVTFDENSKEGYSSAGVLHVTISEEYPLPFNNHIGDIFIAGLWDGDGGVISIVFADIDIITSEFKFYGLYTVPISEKDGKIVSLFAEQDIIIGEGSDTLLNLSLSKPKFNTELARLNAGVPGDVFTAISQKVWFLSINQHGTLSDVYDDSYVLNGGGQIAEVRSRSGGILYHALIETEFSYDECKLNPQDGTAFIQNIKASGSSVDLGNITLDFHDDCDGRARVKVATGKYIGSNGKEIVLDWD